MPSSLSVHGGTLDSNSSGLSLGSSFPSSIAGGYSLNPPLFSGPGTGYDYYVPGIGHGGLVSLPESSSTIFITGGVPGHTGLGNRDYGSGTDFGGVGLGSDGSNSLGGFSGGSNGRGGNGGGGGRGGASVRGGSGESNAASFASSSSSSSSPASSRTSFNQLPLTDEGQSADYSPFTWSTKTLAVPKNAPEHMRAASRALTNSNVSLTSVPQWLLNLLSEITLGPNSPLASISSRYSGAVDCLNRVAAALSLESHGKKWGASGPPAIDRSRVAAVQRLLGSATVSSTPNTLTKNALACRRRVLTLLADAKVAFSEFELGAWFDPKAECVIHGFPVNETGGDDHALPLFSNAAMDWAASMKPGTLFLHQLRELGKKVVRIDMLNKTLPWDQCDKGFDEWEDEIENTATLLVGCEFETVYSHGHLANDAIRKAASTKFEYVKGSVFGLGENRSMIEKGGGSKQIHMLQHPQMHLPSWCTLTVAQVVARRSDDLLRLLAGVMSIEIPPNFGSCEGLSMISAEKGWEGTFSLLDLVRALRTEEILSKKAIPWEELPSSVQNKAMEQPACVSSQETADKFVAKTKDARERGLPSGVLAALSNMGVKGGKFSVLDEPHARGREGVKISHFPRFALQAWRSVELLDPADIATPPRCYHFANLATSSPPPFPAGSNSSVYMTSAGGLAGNGRTKEAITADKSAGGKKRRSR
jgi:hypothetical protein